MVSWAMIWVVSVHGWLGYDLGTARHYSLKSVISVSIFLLVGGFDCAWVTDRQLLLLMASRFHRCSVTLDLKWTERNRSETPS